MLENVKKGWITTLFGVLFLLAVLTLIIFPMFRPNFNADSITLLNCSSGDSFTICSNCKPSILNASLTGVVVSAKPDDSPILFRNSSARSIILSKFKTSSKKQWIR